MLRRQSLFPMVLLCFVVFVGQASALNVVDVDTTDMNIITAQGYGTGGPDSREYFVYEDYNEQYLVPYPSHDGMGIVNAQGGFFDKIVTIDRQLDHGPFVLHFYVYNSTQYLWSDYHFEFWDGTFTNRLVNVPLVSWVNGHTDTMDVVGDENEEVVWVEPFINSSFDGSTVAFWAPKQISWSIPSPGGSFIVQPGGQDPGETNIFQLIVDVDLLPESFGIRQVATTVPEPATLLLLGLGLVGLMCWKRK